MIDRSQLAVGIIGATIGAAGLALVPVQVPSASLAAWSDMRSPAFFPIWASIVVMFSALIILFQVLRGYLVLGEAGFAPARPALVAGIFIAFVALAPWVGTFTCMVLMMVGTSLAFDYRRPLPTIVLALVATAAIYGSFEMALKILFPHGALF